MKIMKSIEYKNGASVFMDDPAFPSGLVTVICRYPNGEIYDKIRCENKAMAKDYYKSFCRIAKNLKN